MEGLAPDANLIASFGLQQSGGPNVSGVRSAEEAARVAREFEGLFISQMLSAMFAGVETPEPFGGGAGEDGFKGLLLEEYGRMLSKTGGIGLAAPLQAEIMRLQGIDA